MVVRTVNATLLIAAVVGAVSAYFASTEYREVMTVHRQLDAMVGMPIRDPSKVHVRAIATGEELFFSWRVYVPEGMNVRWKDNYRGTYIGPRPSDREFIASVCLLASDAGLEISSQDNVAGYSNHIGTPHLARLLDEHVNDIQVEQLGSDGVVMVEADELVTLLRLAFPDDLREEAEQEVDSHWQRQSHEALLRVQLGSAEAFRRAGAGK